MEIEENEIEISLQKSNFDLRSFAELKTLEFIVEKYQRGYKWGTKQVEELLNDIYNFDSKKQSFYCLQPIVVKEVGNHQFELIDGQQRLTTIFIILQCLGVKLFDLDYRTRLQSADFLKQIKTLAVIDLSKTKINDAWIKYAEEQPLLNNVDNYHFFGSYQTIINWLQQLSNIEKEVFISKVLNSIKVIWYNVKSSQSPEEIFINFNQGKIHLEQAELIKALFVLHFNQEPNAEIRAFKTNQFAEEWNSIENQLQENSFWYFVSNDTSNKRQSNRIDLLFDLLKDKPKKEQSNLFAYHLYLEKLNEGTLRKDDWQEVKNLFNLLLEWYRDRSTYHYLGLLIHLEIKSINEAYASYLELDDKREFIKEVKGWIKSVINIESVDSKYNLSALNYQSSYKETLQILIIHNVASYYITDYNYRFPFDKLKTQKWSLEHIHAQNAEMFKCISELNDWIVDIMALLQNINPNPKLDEQLNILKQDISEKDNNEEIPKAIKIKVKLLSEAIDKSIEKHSLKNLCLLDGATNSSIGNSNFKVKRESLLKIDKQGGIIKEGEIRKKVFIPVATKNIFLKYYTKNTEGINFTFWGFEDRKDYEESIENCIKNYLNDGK